MNVETPDIAVDAGDHVVRFYEHELELAATVSEYLAGAVEGGGTAIAIATEATDDGKVVWAELAP